MDTLIRYLTPIVAVYGAVLATVSLAWQVRRTQRRLQVSVSYAFLPRGKELGDQHLCITVANVGERIATINAPCLRLPSGRTFATPIPLGSKFPFELKEGTDAKSFILLHELRDVLIRESATSPAKLIPFVVDQTGTTYWGSEHMLDYRDV